jgi:hypothetical protein
MNAGKVLNHLDQNPYPYSDIPLIGVSSPSLNSIFATGSLVLKIKLSSSSSAHPKGLAAGLTTTKPKLIPSLG